MSDKLLDDLDFFDFCDVVKTLCFTPSMLRMKITKTPPSKLGKKIVISNVSTVILEFMTMEERQSV